MPSEVLCEPNAPENFSHSVQLLAQHIAFTDPVTGVEQLFESLRSLYFKSNGTGAMVRTG